MKLFVCVWGSWIADNTVGNIYNDSIQLHGEDFFNDDNAYTPEDIEYIKGLEVGQSYISEFGNHIVTRIS